MVGQEAKRRELDAITPLGSGEHADDDLVEQRVGSEEKPTVDRAAGDLEEGTIFRSVAELSCHGRAVGGKSPAMSSVMG